MPPGTGLAASSLELLFDWISDGASPDCEGSGTTSPTGEGYHPEGFALPEEHGLAAKLQEQACVTCHGDDLTGGSVGVSCDACHAPGWRTDCTFCHGDARSPGGAPPRDIDGNEDPATITFPAHGAHVTGGIHEPFDCVQCHTKPTDALSWGHLFLGDATPAVAEVAFGLGLSANGAYSGAKGCRNLYCHGNGRGDNGSITLDEGPRTCASCHPGEASGEADWERMSGAHKDHLKERLGCASCHQATTEDGLTIADPGLHVDGTPDVVIGPAGLIYDGRTCTGACHGEVHAGRRWVD
jgi:predicted CxxxxCH...CXXCH cytochrome family protein